MGRAIASVAPNHIAAAAVPPITVAHPDQAVDRSPTQSARWLSFLAGHGILPKLSVSSPGDAEEREADTVADRVMRMQVSPSGPTPISGAIGESINRVCSECASDDEDERIARKAHGSTEVAHASAHVAMDAVSHGGRPLGPSERAFFEPRFGRELSGVRVHHGSRANRAAAGIGALAYTHGRNIAFADGQYRPDTVGGKRLLAHELTHVVQQSGGGTVGSEIQRATTPEIDQIENLLSYGLFDWAIRDSEAINALQILKGLSKYDQATFVSHTKYFNRLRENLPTEKGAELDAIVSSVSDIVPNQAAVEEMDSLLSYGLFDWAVTDKEAIAVLDRLKTLSGPRLALALENIDYGRLLDNLPEDRKPELLDLLSSALGTRGAKATDRAAHPGAILNSLTFTSDHGALKDNDSDWSNSGKVIEPEWSITPQGELTSKPISQTMGTSLSILADISILPPSASSDTVTIKGVSPEPGLNFSFSGSLGGGVHQSIAMTSPNKLPDKVAALNSQIRWTMETAGWAHEIGTSAHTTYVTMNTPINPSEMTAKRMRTAVGIVGPLETNDPMEILKGIMKNWNVYTLSIPLHNPVWKFADEIDAGGQCIDIVNFVQAIIQAIGCPGQADAVVVFAYPWASQVAIEQLWNDFRGLPNRYQNGRYQLSTLLDGNFHANNFEAALKFDYNGTLAYFPGGVDAVMQTPDQVLRVFNCLSWVEPSGGKNGRIAEVSANYGVPPKCHVGDEHECFVE